MFRTRLITVAATVALCLSTAHAGNHHGNKGKGHGKKGGHGGNAQITYDIAADCSVTINSNKKISRIVIRENNGNKIKKWNNINANSFSNFGMYASYLADNKLYIRSGRGGKRNHGRGVEIGDNFRLELEACLMPADDCPFAGEIASFSTSAIAFPDSPDVCALIDPATSTAIGIIDDRANAGGIEAEFAGELSFLAYGIAADCITIAPTPLPGNSSRPGCASGVTDGRLNAQQAQACAALLPQCTTLVIPD